MRLIKATAEPVGKPGILRVRIDGRLQRLSRLLILRRIVQPRYILWQVSRLSVPGARGNRACTHDEQQKRHCSQMPPPLDALCQLSHHSGNTGRMTMLSFSGESPGKATRVPSCTPSSTSNLDASDIPTLISTRCRRLPSTRN